MTESIYEELRGFVGDHDELEIEPPPHALKTAVLMVEQLLEKLRKIDAHAKKHTGGSEANLIAALTVIRGISLEATETIDPSVKPTEGEKQDG